MVATFPYAIRLTHRPRRDAARSLPLGGHKRSPSNDAEGEAVVVDGTGNAYTAGYCANAAQWDNLLVAKYVAGATYRRALLKTWGGEYNAGNDAAIALGPSGTLYVSCEGQSKDGVCQGVIAKYAR